MVPKVFALFVAEIINAQGPLIRQHLELFSGESLLVLGAMLLVPGAQAGNALPHDVVKSFCF